MRRTMDKRAQGQIIHVVKVFDLSSSMHEHVASLVKVADAQVAELAAASKVSDQETRVTVYTFSSAQFHGGLEARCLVYEKDVLRVPSIAGMRLRASGNTALCGAMLKVISDLKLTPEQYGDHSFLLYLLTDGMENASLPASRSMLPKVIGELPDNWTLAAFVPDATAKHYLTRFGFAPGNISVWDPSKEGAVEEVGQLMATASSTYMAMRSSSPHKRSTQNLFEAKSPAAGDLKRTLTRMTPGSYFFEHVDAADLEKITNARIDEFMELKTGKPYIPGRTYYEMTQRVRIQPDKKIVVAIWSKEDNSEDVFTGPEARAKLGLPDDGRTEVRVSPGKWNAKGYKVFVQSNSNNRKLVPGTRVLVVRLGTQRAGGSGGAGAGHSGPGRSSGCSCSSSSHGARTSCEKFPGEHIRFRFPGKIPLRVKETRWKILPPGVPPRT
jgi:hypothetical protein